MSQSTRAADLKAEVAAEKVHQAEVRAEVKAAVPKPLTKREEFIKLVDALRQQVTDMQIRPEFSRRIFDGYDQIIRATDGEEKK